MPYASVVALAVLVVLHVVAFCVVSVRFAMIVGCCDCFFYIYVVLVRRFSLSCLGVCDRCLFCPVFLCLRRL